MEEKEIKAEDLVEEIDDFDLVEEECEYEVWLVGDNADNCATDFDVMIDDGYTELEEAKKCYEYCTIPENLKAKLEAMQVVIPEEVAHVYLRLEAVIPEGPDMMMCNELMDECEVNIFKK